MDGTAAARPHSPGSGLPRRCRPAGRDAARSSGVAGLVALAGLGSVLALGLPPAAAGERPAATPAANPVTLRPDPALPVDPAPPVEVRGLPLDRLPAEPVGVPRAPDPGDPVESPAGVDPPDRSGLPWALVAAGALATLVVRSRRSAADPPRTGEPAAGADDPDVSGYGDLEDGLGEPPSRRRWDDVDDLPDGAALRAGGPRAGSPRVATGVPALLARLTAALEHDEAAGPGARRAALVLLRVEAPEPDPEDPAAAGAARADAVLAALDAAVPVVARVAGRWRRAGDPVVRLGVNRLAVVLLGCGAVEARRVATRLEEALAAGPAAAGTAVRVASAAAPRDAATARGLLRVAERALLDPAAGPDADDQVDDTGAPREPERLAEAVVPARD